MAEKGPNNIYCQHCKMKFSKPVFYKSHFNGKCLQSKITIRPSKLKQPASNLLSNAHEESENWIGKRYFIEYNNIIT